MPSKGLSIYSYISMPGYQVEFSVPGPNGVIVNGPKDNFTCRALEMESHNIPGLRNFIGKFMWRVLRNGEEVASAWNRINTFTGNLAGGDLVSTQHFSPLITDDAIITYGFYDAGHGEAGLTNRDQCYVTICPMTNKHWMGTVAPPGSPAAQKPFSRFVLAAPHDNGMNSMTNADLVLHSLGIDDIPFIKELIPHLHFFSEFPDSALLHMLPNIVYGVSVTQKKEIAVMLALGARYFEFRPAKLLPLFRKASGLPDKYYFQHACIPGIALDEFLEDQVEFLDANPTEIVVLHFRYDNILKDMQKPTNDEIDQILTDACGKAQNQPLHWGGRECFSKPIDELRQSGTRLIRVIMADKYDSWTADAYRTLSFEPILKRFESMNTEGQQSTDLTILQCQATSQSIKEVLVYSVLASNAATSCLTSTKAMNDLRTLPWIRQHALDRLEADRNIIIMNDFIDGATTDTSILLSKRRLDAE